MQRKQLPGTRDTSARPEVIKLLPEQYKIVKRIMIKINKHVKLVSKSWRESSLLADESLLRRERDMAWSIEQANPNHPLQGRPRPGPFHITIIITTAPFVTILFPTRHEYCANSPKKAAVITNQTDGQEVHCGQLFLFFLSKS